MDETSLREAIELIKAGNRKEGGQILTELVKQEPNNETAWLWLSTCFSKPGNKIICLHKVLEINPTNEKAIEGLRKLTEAEEPTLEAISNIHLRVPAKTSKTNAVSSSKPVIAIPGTHNLKLYYLLGGGGVVIALVLLVAFVLISSIGKRGVIAHVFATPTIDAPTATVLPPTMTAKPTRTTRPSSTPWPTNPPKPTITPKPTDDPIEITYIKNFWDMSRKCQAAGELMETQMRRASSTGDAAGVMSIAKWQEDTERALSSIEATCAQWKNIGPAPLMFQESHSYIVGFSDETQLAVNAYRIGFPNMDVDAIIEGNDHIGKSQTFLDKISEYMRNFPEH